jgi:cellulose synthase/poly-beta-1,6-N-acetylglucosamine synthase-like glycosyltransferase
MTEGRLAGPLDRCAAHRRFSDYEPSLNGLVRWGGLTLIVLFLMAVPYFYFQYHLWLSGTALHTAEFVILGGFLAWILGRPLAVRITAAHVNCASSRLPEEVRSHGVSVVVPCYNAANKVEHTVRSLLQQTVRPIELIFVENNSTDDTLEVLRRLEREAPELRVFSVDVRPGEYAASVAINYGISMATHDIIVRMDDDTLMDPNAVARAIPPLLDGTAAAVACNLRVANPRTTLWTRLQSLEYLLAMELDRRSQVILDTVLCCSGGMSVFRRDVLLEAGGFCSLPRWVSEDLDMTMKSHRLGSVSSRPTSVGFTTVPETLHGVVRQRYRWAICGTVAVYLHRRGLARRGYWYDGRVGFLGLPMRAIMLLRDLCSPVYPLYLTMLFQHGGALWLGAVLAVQMVALMAQLGILSGVLHERQGLAYWWMTPVFTLVYGPVLFATRFIGSWSGVAHVAILRRKEDRLEHAGLQHGYAVASVAGSGIA